MFGKYNCDNVPCFSTKQIRYASRCAPITLDSSLNNANSKGNTSSIQKEKLKNEK
jgi:hypothetical protein